MNSEFLGDNAGVFFDGEYHRGIMNQMPFQPQDASAFVQPQGYINNLTINADDATFVQPQGYFNDQIVNAGDATFVQPQGYLNDQTVNASDATFVQPQGYFNRITVNEMPRHDELVTNLSMVEQPVYATTGNANGQQEPMPMSNGVMGDAMSAGNGTIGSNGDLFDGDFTTGLGISQPSTHNAAAAANDFSGNSTAGPVQLRQKHVQQEPTQNALQQEMTYFLNLNEHLHSQLAAKIEENDHHKAEYNTVFGILENEAKPLLDVQKQQIQRLKNDNAWLLALLRDRDVVPRQSVAAVCDQLHSAQMQLGEETHAAVYWKAKAQQLDQQLRTFSQPPLDPKSTVSQSSAPRIRKSPARRNQKPRSTAPADVPTTAFLQASRSVQPSTQVDEVRQKGFDLHSPIDLTNDEPESSESSQSNKTIATPDSHATADTGATGCSAMDESAAVLNKSAEVPCGSTTQASNVDPSLAANATNGEANQGSGPVDGQKSDGKDPAGQQLNAKKTYAWCTSKSGAPGRFVNEGVKGNVGLLPIQREKAKEKEKKASKKRAADGQTEGNAKATKKRKGSNTTTKRGAPQASASASPKANLQARQKKVGAGSGAKRQPVPVHKPVVPEHDTELGVGQQQHVLLDDSPSDDEAEALKLLEAQLTRELEMEAEAEEAAAMKARHGKGSQTTAAQTGTGVSVCAEHTANEKTASANAEGKDSDAQVAKEVDTGETVEQELEILDEELAIELFGPDVAMASDEED